MKTILVIKHGAFGDLIHATHAFHALRRFYKEDQLVLLTDPKFSNLTSSMPYFDKVLFDERRPGLRHLLKVRTLLRQGNFHFVYDLQVSQRTNTYHKLFFPKPAPLWSGSARKCSHYIGSASFDTIHVHDRLYKQLSQAGVITGPQEDFITHIDWLKDDTWSLNIPDPFVILIPGSSKNHPYKRWPLSYYEEMALKLIHKGFTIVPLGGPDEQDLINSLCQLHPSVHAFPSLLSFAQIATLGRRACFAIGNDTGPSHLIAATHCPTYYCWSGASPPKIFAPRGGHVTLFFEPDLKNLTVDTVWNHLKL